MKTKLPTEWQELIDQLGSKEFTPIQTQLFETYNRLVKIFLESVQLEQERL